MALQNSSSQGAMRICCPWIAISISKIPPTCGMRWNLCKDSVHFRIYIESIADPRQRFPDGQQYISLFGTPMASFLHLKPRNVQGLQVMASKRFPQSMTPVPKDDFPVEPPSLRSRLKRGISIKFSQKKTFPRKKDVYVDRWYQHLIISEAKINTGRCIVKCSPEKPMAISFNLTAPSLLSCARFSRLPLAPEAAGQLWAGSKNHFWADGI